MAQIPPPSYTRGFTEYIDEDGNIWRVPDRHIDRPYEYEPVSDYRTTDFSRMMWNEDLPGSQIPQGSDIMRDRDGRVFWKEPGGKWAEYSQAAGDFHCPICLRPAEYLIAMDISTFSEEAFLFLGCACKDHLDEILTTPPVKATSTSFTFPVGHDDVPAVYYD